MKKDLMEKIDRNYIFLTNVTNAKQARKFFENYLLESTTTKRSGQYLDSIFEGLSKYDIVSQIAKYALLYSCQNNIEEDILFDYFKKQLIKDNVSYDEVVEYLSENKVLFRELVSRFVKHKYEDKKHIVLNKEINDKEIKKYISSLDSNSKKETKHSKLGMIRNFVLNSSRQDIIGNSQYMINNKSYSLGKDLYATIDRGDKSLSQEDAVLLLKHPDNNNFKLIAVADGESSKVHSEEASNYTLYSLLKWFEDLDSRYFKKPKELKELLENKLRIINYDLQNNLISNATTIALAIIGENNTIISTIGDTKIYLIKDDKIIDETKEDSYVRILCEKGLADPKTAKFHKAANILNYELGSSVNKEVISNNTRIISKDYDKLLILTDGITRLVDNDKIEKIIRNNNDKEIVNELVKTAKSEPVILDGIDLYCNNRIETNQNNMTAAMYIKKRR